MDNLMKLVIASLEWSYEAKAPDVQVKWLERAAELLVLRHDTSGLSMEPRLALKQIRLRELSLCRRVRRLLPRSLPRRKSKRSHLRSPQDRLPLHNLRRRRRRLPPHRTNARFLGPCSSTSSVLRRVVLRVWSVLAVGEYGPFLQAAEFCASSLTTYAKRALPIPDNDGPGEKGKQTGVWSAGKQTSFPYL